MHKKFYNMITLEAFHKLKGVKYVEILYWILAFLGIIIIYGGCKIINKFAKKDLSDKQEMLVKLVGIAISAIGLVLLYTSGALK